MTVKTDDVRQQILSEHGLATGLLFKNDLQQDAARQVLGRLGVHHRKHLVLHDQLLDLG